MSRAWCYLFHWRNQFRTTGFGWRGWKCGKCGRVWVTEWDDWSDPIGK